MTNIQKEIKELEKLIYSKTGKNLSAYAKVTMLVGEVGELSDEVIALEGDRVEDKNYSKKDELAKEIVDVIINAVTLANHYSIDLEQYFTNRVNKIKEKFD